MILAVSSVLIKQQCTLSKVSLDQNTHKTRLCFDQLVEMCSEARRNLSPCFLEEQWGSVCEFSVSRLLEDVTLANNEPQMCLLLGILIFPLEKSLPGMKESLVIIESNSVILH